MTGPPISRPCTTSGRSSGISTPMTSPGAGIPSTGQPGTGQEESGNHPLNDLQESILAAAHQLRADGHPPNTP
jgi:hypothetical protein